MSKDAYTRAGPVLVTRPDGTKEARPAYTPSQVETVVRKRRKPGSARKRREHLTGAELYPGFAHHRTEWDEVLGLARPIVKARCAKHASPTVSIAELEPFAFDACLRAFLQWRSQNPEPAEAVVDGKLHPHLATRVKREVETDVLNGVRSLDRARVSTVPEALEGRDRRRANEWNRVQPRKDEASLPWSDRSGGVRPWIERADFEEFLTASRTVPDPIDGLLIDVAYHLVYRPEELKRIGLPKLPDLELPLAEGKTLADRENRWLVEWVLVWLFSRPWVHHVCPLEIGPRLRRASRWLDEYTAARGEVSAIPTQGRQWIGRDRRWPSRGCPRSETNVSTAA